MKTFWLVDGHSIAYRSYFAFMHNPLRNSKGENTSAVFGFINSLVKLLTEKKPEYMFVAFDAPHPTFRHEQFKDYKIQRPPTPSDLSSQFPIIKNVVEIMGVTLIEKPGVEADDIIGTVAIEARDKGFEVTIFADDKDFLQLESQGIKILSARTFEFVHCEEKLGIPPALVADYLALTGDSIDNIPGVYGIGPKNAQKLITEIGGLDKIYDNISAVKGEKIKESLVKNKDNAYMSKMLATIKTDVDIGIDISEMTVKETNKEKLFNILRELEFYSLVKKLIPDSFEVANKDNTVKGKTKVATSKGEQSTLSIFSQIPQKQEVPESALETDWDSFLKGIGDKVSVAFKDKGFALGTDKGKIVFSDGSDKKENLEKLNSIINNEDIEKITVDSKYLFHNFRVKGKVFDIGLAGYLLEPGVKEPSLEAMSIKWLGKTLVSSDAVDYLGKSVDVCTKAYPVLKAKLEEEGLNTIYNDIELPLAKILAGMEEKGVLINKKYFTDESEKLGIRINKIEESIYDDVGERFNLRSPSQLSKILFEKLNLPKSKHKKTHYSTEQDVLDELAKIHPLPKKILDYRELFKLKSTYIDTLPVLADENNRVHTIWQQTGTITGRLSSKDPNLQNIPDMEIKQGFIAPEGYVIMDADYSQIELRILAGVSRDDTLLEAFNNNEDIHKKTAGLIFNVPEEQVSQIQRNIAKVVNFGIVYGMGPFGLAQRLNILPEEALIFITSYFLTYPGVKNWIDKQIENAKKNGYVETILGRKRWLPNIGSEKGRSKEFEERVAINAPLQGTAADMIKIAMIKIQPQLKDFSANIIMQVHDELVLEVPENKIEEVKSLVKYEMENALDIGVPVVVGIGVGKDWHSAHP
ncbi:MAG: DNA polymerase I [bacterium]|nr:DNA polymerase I [bacterium]